MNTTGCDHDPLHALEAASEIVGGKWRSTIVYFLTSRPKRFSELEKEISKISQRMLVLDLKKLEKSGIISRTILSDRPVTIEYKLTPLGIELGNIVQQLAEFGKKASRPKASDLDDPQ